MKIDNNFYVNLIESSKNVTTSRNRATAGIWGLKGLENTSNVLSNLSRMIFVDSMASLIKNLY